MALLVTSCKDYDDDINKVETIADANNALIKKLQEQTSALQTALTTAQSTADAAKTAAADAATAAKNAQATGDDALAKAKTAEAAAEAAKAAAAEAQKAAIEEATKQVKELKDQVDAALSQKLDVAVFNEAVTKLEGTIAGIDETLNKLGDDVKKNQNDIKTAQETIATLTAAQKDAAIQIAALEAYKKTLESETIPGLNEAIKANGIEINGVKKSVEDLKKATEDAQKKLSDEIAKVSGDLTALQATVNGIDEAYKKADADLQEQIKDLLKTVNTNKDEAASAIKLAVKDINKLMDSNKTELEKYAKDEAAKAAKAVKDDLQKQIDALSKITINGTEQGLAEWMTDINDKFNKYYTTGQIDEKITELTKDYKKAVADAAKEASEALSDAVKKINTDLGGKIQTLHILVAKRLTSIVFAPTTYINGIEAIKFATLKYYDWGTKAADWEADKAKMEATDTKVWTYINDKETIVNYLLNPTGVTLDDIASLEFVSQEATNETRAAGAPIQVADKKVVDGKLILNVQKVGNAPLGSSGSKFPIVALKAKLADKVLAENEQNVFVYSDWARLYESTERPFIHNVKAKNEDGTPSETQFNSHFWDYSTVYGGGTKAVELSWPNNYDYIAAEVDYNKSVDLNKLVEVCDKQGSIYDLDKFGLKFEFHLMDYKLKNELQTVDATNQIHFGKLLEDGHTLVATSRDGKVGNRDAIGRQPMIQAVLKDVNDPKNVKVVDVRYFKVKWTDVLVTKNYGALRKDFSDKYSCGESYDFIVKEEAVNKLYASEDMSRDEFHTVYTPSAELYPTAEDAAAGENAYSISKTSFADVHDWTDPGQTHNMKWSLNIADFKATQAEYEAGKAVRTVYGVFYKNSNRNSKIIFSLTAVLKINKMAYADGLNYGQEQWAPAGLTMANGLSNASKARTINPALRSDATYGTANFTDAQIIGDLKAGYINNGQVPATVAALVKNAEHVNLIFDEARLSEVASATNTKTADWTVANYGYELKYKNEAAAEITTKGVISLKEMGEAGKGGNPTAGALLLVGKKVPVILNTDYCGLNETIDKYLVNFMQPLTMNDIKITDNLVDIIDGGSVSVSIKDKIIIKEAFGLKRTILGPANQLHAEAEALRTWYIVKAPFWDQANIKTNLQKNGTIGSSVNQKLSELKNADGSPKYRVEVNGTAQTVTFHNMSGNAISQPFQISIPVSVETKWGTFTQNVIINVKPGN